MSDLYEGPATLRIGDDERVVRVRLAGHIQPIDGRYHWQGTIFDAPLYDAKFPQAVTLSSGEHHAQARITERTPQGGYSVSGVGAPPFTIS